MKMKCHTMQARPGAIVERVTKGLNVSGEEAFICDDEKGNGCGRMFDGTTVRRVQGLCEGCAADLPEEAGC